MKSIIYIYLVLLVFTSCEEALYVNEPGEGAEENFEYLWKQIDEKYSFFDLKKIDWDSVYNVYSPLVNSEMGELALFRVLADMLSSLRDGHVNLFTSFNISRNWTWYLDYPQNFNYTNVERNYLRNNYYITGSLKHTKIGNVAYVYYSSFANPIDNDDLKFVLKTYEPLKGIVIDVRDNGGGTLSNGLTFACPFTDEKRHVLTTYFKTGAEHDDFGDAKKVYITPQDDLYYSKKVIVLTNRKCYSTTNFFVAAMKSIPNCTILGDTTGGGGGIPIGGELPNGWTYRFSGTQTYMPDGWNIELGVPPDTVINLDPTYEAYGADNLIEEALRIIERTGF